MKIGIISDTHDDLDNVQKAIKIFNERNATFVIHAGDYIFPGVIEEFKKLHDTAKLIGVLGNNDGERIGLLNKFKEIDGELKGEFGEKNIDGINFGIYHGTNKELKQALIRSGQYDVFICGHTHQREDRKEGKTQVLNPGTAHRHFPNIDGKIEDKSRIIIYDTKTKEYEFIELPELKT